MLLFEGPGLDETFGLETSMFIRWTALPLWLFECLWALALKVWSLLPVIELALACNRTKEGCVRWGCGIGVLPREHDSKEDRNCTRTVEDGVNQLAVGNSWTFLFASVEDIDVIAKILDRLGEALLFTKSSSRGQDGHKKEDDSKHLHIEL